MTATRPVLITTSVIVHVPEETQEDFTFVEPLSVKLRQTIKEAFEQVPEAEYPGVTDLNPIWIEGTNIGRCDRCGCWVTDYTRPDQLPGIPGGRRIGGDWVCDECEVFGS